MNIDEIIDGIYLLPQKAIFAAKKRDELVIVDFIRRHRTGVHLLSCPSE